MTREEIINRLLAQKSCLKCQVSGKRCNENCPTQYDAGTIDETIETLGETIKIIEKQKSLEDELENIKTEINFIAEKCLPNNIAEEYEVKGLKTALEIINKHIKEN